ncbi:MAG: DUF2341 domain-containing protein [Candidatus Hodarchaeota archaeon]
MRKTKKTFNFISIFGLFLVISSLIAIKLPVDDTGKQDGVSIPGGIVKASSIEYTQVNITPATPEANYQVRLDLDSSFNYSNCQPNGEDIRFYDGSNTSLSYWIEEWNNGGNSIIWINVLQSGTSSITMEYGNLALPAKSSGDDTFLFFDDFSGASIDPSKWDVYTTTYSTASVSSGILYLISDTPSSHWLRASHGFANMYSIEGVPYGAQGEDAAIFNGGGGVFTRNLDVYDNTIENSTIYPHEFYERWFTSEVQFVNSSLVKFYDNDALITEITTNIPDNTMRVNLYTMAAYYPSGDHYAAYINSTDPALGQPGRALRASTWNHYRNSVSAGTDDSEVRVDWIFVRKTSENEPVASYDLGFNNTIILIPGNGVYDQFKLSHNIEFYINMLNFGTLTFEAPSIPQEEIVVEGINGMIRPMLGHAFDILIEDENYINFASARIYYDDSDIPDGVKEEQLLVLKKNEKTGEWEALPLIIINEGGNYIDFDIEADALYILVGRTANNNVPIIVIIIITGTCIAGIVAGVRIKKSKKLSKITVPSKKKRLYQYEAIGKQTTMTESDTVYRKRERLMRATIQEVELDDDEPVILIGKKKSSQILEVPVDIRQREKNAAQMESEIKLAKITPHCLVHKDEIKGLSYTCNHCGAIYCIKCTQYLIQAGETCWNCHAPVPEELLDVQTDTGLKLPIPKTDLAIFSQDVWNKIEQLEKDGKINREIFDEVIGLLKLLPPSERLEYLEGDMFDVVEDDDD